MRRLQVRRCVACLRQPALSRGGWTALACLAAARVLLAHPAVISAAEEPSPRRDLESRLTPLIRDHKGTVSVAVKHLKTGESFRYHAEQVMPTASLIKFPVMVEAYRQAESGQVDLDSTVTLHDSDKVPGSGILTSHFSDGSTFRLRDAVRLMIAFSDNTATNLVLDAIGMGSTAETMERMGYPNTKIHSKVFRPETAIFPDRRKEFGLGSTSADEMIRLCEELHAHRLVSQKASDAMLEHLRACEDRDKFPRLLPPETKIAFKTGSLADTRTAAGILECPAGPVAICVMSHHNEDQRWVPENAGNMLCAEVARAVFEHFGGSTTGPATSASTPAAGSGGSATAKPNTPASGPKPSPRS